MANQFLIKETMTAMQGLSAAEITALQNGSYDGVQLLGYYQKGDTPAPIIYYYFNPLTDPDPGPKDEGSVIETGGIKLFHDFKKFIHVSYFGIIGNKTDDYTNKIKSLLMTQAENTTFKFSGRYKVSSTLNVLKLGTKIIGDDLVFEFIGDFDSKFISVEADNFSVHGATFDAMDKQLKDCFIHLTDNIKNPSITDCIFKNALGIKAGTSNDQQYGVMISPYGVSNFLIDQCLFSNIKNDNTGTQAGSLKGFCGGIYISDPRVDAAHPNAKVQTDFVTGNISNCRFSDIMTKLDDGLSQSAYTSYNDADGIRFYGGGKAQNCDVNIDNCYFKNVGKRAIKISYMGNVKVNNISVEADGLQYQMISLIKINKGTSVKGVRYYGNGSSLQIAFQSDDGGDIVLEDVIVDGCEVFYEINPSFQSADSEIRNILIKDIVVKNLFRRGILSNNGYAKIARNIVLENIYMEADPARNSVQALNAAFGWQENEVFIKNFRTKNCDVRVDGGMFNIDGLHITIDNPNFLGSTNPLGNSANVAWRKFNHILDLGDNSSHRDSVPIFTSSASITRTPVATNITIDIQGISASYFDAAVVGSDLSINDRKELVNFNRDRLKVQNVTYKYAAHLPAPLRAAIIFEGSFLHITDIKLDSESGMFVNTLEGNTAKTGIFISDVFNLTQTALDNPVVRTNRIINSKICNVFSRGIGSYPVVSLGSGSSGNTISEIVGNATPFSVELLGSQPNTRVYNVFNQTDSYSPKGTTLQRPTTSLVGQEYFDITLNRPVWWNGSTWVDGKQSAASPDTAADPSNTYMPSEVQAILAELRDLKTKLRSAGILAI
ncbi:hypothetical protein [Sphingobacterium detergens]|uniref:Parallel beta helix pectate lyase-like protein n=1 Tax=Sphingobacterium detergens TaxID=1145106 RepID=A0A420BF46_SPHD1|nr:hypothetical protein [Sphingobacterium detergens]RKE55331.1 hypothetical protein DFQ12_0162 [Sphingobacterium detergens]